MLVLAEKPLQSQRKEGVPFFKEGRRLLERGVLRVPPGDPARPWFYMEHFGPERGSGEHVWSGGFASEKI